MFNNPDVQKYNSIEEVPIVADTTGRVLPRQVSTGVSRGSQQMGTDSVILNNSAGRLEVNVNNIPQIFLGKFPDGTFGLVVSKVGVDVNTLFP